MSLDTSPTEEISNTIKPEMPEEEEYQELEEIKEEKQEPKEIRGETYEIPSQAPPIATDQPRTPPMTPKFDKMEQKEIPVPRKKEQAQEFKQLPPSELKSIVTEVVQELKDYQPTSIRPPPTKIPEEVLAAFDVKPGWSWLDETWESLSPEEDKRSEEEKHAFRSRDIPEAASRPVTDMFGAILPTAQEKFDLWTARMNFMGTHFLTIRSFYQMTEAMHTTTDKATSNEDIKEYIENWKSIPKNARVSRDQLFQNIAKAALRNDDLQMAKVLTLDKNTQTSVPIQKVILGDSDLGTYVDKYVTIYDELWKRRVNPEGKYYYPNIVGTERSNKVKKLGLGATLGLIALGLTSAYLMAPGSSITNTLSTMVQPIRPASDIVVPSFEGVKRNTLFAPSAKHNILENLQVDPIRQLINTLNLFGNYYNEDPEKARKEANQFAQNQALNPNLGQTLKNQTETIKALIKMGMAGSPEMEAVIGGTADQVFKFGTATADLMGKLYSITQTMTGGINWGAAMYYYINQGMPLQLQINDLAFLGLAPILKTGSYFRGKTKVAAFGGYNPFGDNEYVLLQQTLARSQILQAENLGQQLGDFRSIYGDFGTPSNAVDLDYWTNVVYQQGVLDFTNKPKNQILTWLSTFPIQPKYKDKLTRITGLQTHYEKGTKAFERMVEGFVTVDYRAAIEELVLMFESPEGLQDLWESADHHFGGNKKAMKWFTNSLLRWKDTRDFLGFVKEQNSFMNRVGAMRMVNSIADFSGWNYEIPASVSWNAYSGVGPLTEGSTIPPALRKPKPLAKR